MNAREQAVIDAALAWAEERDAPMLAGVDVDDFMMFFGASDALAAAVAAYRAAGSPESPQP